MEGWTLNSAGRTEGRSSHPNERKRGGPEQKRKKRCAQNKKKIQKQPRGCGTGGELGFACAFLPPPKKKYHWPPDSNDLKATSFTFHRRMGDFPRRFVRSRWWRISAAVPFTATARLPTTSESETTESTAYSLPCRCDSPCEVMVSAWLRCSSSVSAPSFTSWTEDPLKSCWTSDSISVRTFSLLLLHFVVFALLAEARHHQRDSFESKKKERNKQRKKEKLPCMSRRPALIRSVKRIVYPTWNQRRWGVHLSSTAGHKSSLSFFFYDIHRRPQRPLSTSLTSEEILIYLPWSF